MGNTFKLFKLLIDEKMDLFKGKTSKKRAIIALIKYFLLVLGVTIVCNILVGKVTQIGIALDKEMLSIIILFTHVLSFIMSLGTLISTLYTAKDTELLLCLPSTNKEIFVAKLMTAYVKDFISNLLYFLPIFLTYALLSRAGIEFYLLLPVFLLILPVFPMMIAALASIPVMLILQILKKKLWLSITVTLLACAAGIMLYMNVVTDIVDVINFSGKQMETVIAINAWVDNFAKSNVIYTFIAKAMHGEKAIIAILLLVLISAISLVVASLLVEPFYFKIATKHTETGSTDSIINKKFKEENAIISLIKKEFLVTFRTPGYIFQFFIFVLLMPFIVLVYDKMLIAITVSKAGKIMISGAHLMVLSILTSLSCCVSASAISREGGCYYIMKTAPVTFKKQTIAKVLFNVIIVFVAILVTTITTLIFVDIKPLYVVMSSIIAFISSIGQICWNYSVDLKKPTLDWYDSGEISTLSRNTAFSILTGMIVSFALAFLVFLFVNLSYIWILLILIVTGFTLYRIRLLNLRINYYFKINEI